MPFELDHFFTFVSPDFSEEKKLKSLGFIISQQKEHTEQGTSAKYILCEQTYLEWIWISDEKDAENNPLQLHRRSQWQKTGHCPFGVGLRGRLTEKEKKDFWLYEPPYFPGEKIWVHNSSKSHPNLPLFFVQEMKETEVYSDWWFKPRLEKYYHGCLNPYSGITKLEITLPDASGKHPHVDQISFSKANNFHVFISIADLKKEHNIMSFVSLTSP